MAKAPKTPADRPPADTAAPEPAKPKNGAPEQEQVNGAIVRPGETFSLNGYTGPRTAATGYVDAGIIDHGRPSRGIGGGISQFATTLYNATYFAGMTDVEHKEHSYYISRYPAAREATRARSSHWAAAV